MPGSRLVIIGAGPTGLGAGRRLAQLGHDDWVILEASDGVGGLARSFVDSAGFTYDIGTHVLFSRQELYNAAIADVLGNDCVDIRRDVSAWVEDKHTPYPFQNHLRELRPETTFECLAGLIEAQRQQSQPANFQEWIVAVFGRGIARHFMFPFNEKVWATPLDQMAFDWIGERVSVVDVETVLRNVILGEEQRDWGPNQTFRYPLRGGIGALWERVSAPFRDHIELSRPVVAVDAEARTVTTEDGRRWPYDALLSTMPVNDLIGRVAGAPHRVRAAATDLVSTGIHVVGVALDRRRPTVREAAGADAAGVERSRCWVYYPQQEIPFQRLTYLSNYSPHMTPQPGQTLLLTETSTSAHRPVDASTIREQVTTSLARLGLIQQDDRIVTTWHCYRDKAYPVPSLGRDAALRVIEPWLTDRDLASRGRFGAWRYEIGNMDHSFMQGTEWVDRTLKGTPETLWQPCAR